MSPGKCTGIACLLVLAARAAFAVQQQAAPRGAFLGASESAGMSSVWFWAGVYVVAGLVFGALAAHRALQTGNPALDWFGAAGLNAALAAQERGLRALVLEKNKMANTIEDFPDGKWVYAEPDSSPPKGKLWLDGARKEDLIARWH